MAKNKTFFSSFNHAARGFKDALKRERNLKFHVCIGDLICFFAAHYGIGRSEWAVLFVVIGFVIACELLNSGIEKAVDTATKELRADAMHAKDFAAAATLVSAAAALAVGVAIFADAGKIAAALIKIFTSPVSICVLAVLILIDLRILFINYRLKK